MEKERMSSQLERLKAEEEAAEAAFGNPEVTVPIEEVATLESDELASATTVEQSEDELDAAAYIEDTIMGVGEQETHEVQPEAKVPANRTNWKKRFTNFKASADATIYDLRTEVSQMKGQMATLYEELGKVREAGMTTTQKDPFAGVFSEEDEATFGADGLDVVKKGTQAAIDNATKPLKDQLAKVDKDRIDSLKAEAQRAEQGRYNDFIGRLGDLIPDYKEVNYDPKFLAWMKLPDTYSGITRAQLFTQAEKAKDVARVAEFFVEFSHDAKPKVVSEAEKHITPMGGPGASPAPIKTKETEGKIIYLSEIDKFYDDVIKGRYHGKHDQVLNIEAQIDRAQMAGLIRKG